MRRPGRSSLEINALLFDDKGTVKDLGMNGGDVLAQDAGEEELDGGEEEKADDHRRLADGKPVPKEKLTFLGIKERHIAYCGNGRLLQKTYTETRPPPLTSSHSHGFLVQRSDRGFKD